MKTIGLIGGMSWESTVTYYQLLNRMINQKMGGFHSAKCILYSVDFAEIEECQAKGEWEKSGDILAEAAKSLEKAGADYIAICTNTMHKVFDQVQGKISIPLIHIAMATAEELMQENISKVALLGTKYTMTQDFYKDKLLEVGIEVLIPCENDIEKINSVIFNELCQGVIQEQSRYEFIRIIGELEKQGAQGIILGCTEIGLIIKQEDVLARLFDTTIIHAKRLATLAFEE